MKADKLESLLYCFMEQRSHDEVDAVIGGNISGEDHPLFPLVLAHGAVCSGPVSPLLQASSLNSSQRAQTIGIGRELVQLAASFESSQPQRNPIEFKDSCEFVTPEKKITSLTVMRSSSCTESPLKVKWKTSDRTAIAGIHYVESSGEIVFDEGDLEKDIEIAILKSSTDHIDLRFQVQLSVENCVFTPKPMTVSIKSINKFYPEEQSVLNSMLRASTSNVSNIRCILDHCLNDRTFHTALSYACSKADTLPLEFAIAFELSTMCLPSLRQDTILNILGDFFRLDQDDL